MIANILSITRLVSALFLYHFPLEVMILSAFTDFMDGFIARLLNQTSYIGALLDIIADKCVLSIWYIYAYHTFNLGLTWLILMYSRDLILAIGFIYMVSRKIKAYSIMIGKLYISIHMTSAILLLLGYNISLLYIYLTCILSIISIFAYYEHNR